MNRKLPKYIVPSFWQQQKTKKRQPTIVTDQKKGRESVFVILPLQSTKHQMHKIRTLNIGRQK